MTLKLNVINATFRRILGVALILSLGFVFSCDNGDDEPDPETWVWPGVYTFNKAILQTALTVPGVPITIPAGSDITAQMAGGLLANAPCTNPANGAVELKSNNKLFFHCLTETNELDAGTWEYKDADKSLDLNMASPPLPAALQLKIQDVTTDLDTDIVAGSITNFPLTKDLVSGMIPVGTPGRDAIIAGIPDDYVSLIDVDIEFKKVE
ncbi:MAG: hypothetical protein U5K79_00660 [Cyclobacteriaceae bacterium]|nr:hypothetical protein [Cyclobacteriaceae bacterium]